MSKDKSKINSQPIAKLLPNLITLVGLSLGLFAIKYAIVGKWEIAVLLVIIASFLDGFDGGIARMLNASSKFGAELDTLADFLNFSIAPALILYLWQTHEIKGIGWAASLFFIICGAIRLARFNVVQNDDDIDPEIKDKFFTGIPAPSAAGLSLLPMIITFLFNEKFAAPLFEITPVITITVMLSIAFLMISRVPTISIKKIKIRKEYSSLVLAGAVLFIIALVTEPWITLPLLATGYILTIPLAIVLYYKNKSN